MNDITAIESVMGLSFNDRGLLWQALTHTTYARFLGTPEAHNQWLAVFGDTLLDLIVVEYLDRVHGNQHSNGFISETRDKLVSDEALILFAEKIDLRTIIRVKREDDRISPKDIADSFEALLAAIYLDRGLDIARDWFFSQLPKQTISQIEERFYQKSAADRVLAEKFFVTESLISALGTDYKQLDTLLSTGRWQAADLETREVMLRVVGRVDFLPRELIEEFSCEDLRIIDRLWKHYSGNRFGFSIQSEILNEVGGNWDNFGERVGWRIDGIWQPKDDRRYDLQAPAGHLPSAAIRAAGGGKARTRILNRLEGCRSC
jgi:dsRNA-specific ribonuclease